MSTETEDRPSREGRRNLWRLLRRYGSGYYSYIVAGILLTMGANLLAHAVPIVLGSAINTVFTTERAFSLPLVPQSTIPEGRIGQFWLTASVIACLSLGSVLLQAAQDWVWGWFAQYLQHEIRVDAYATVQRLDMEFYDDARTGDIMSVLNNDVNQLEEFFMETVPVAIRVLVMTVGIAGFMLWYHWQLALVTLSVLPVMLYIVHRFEEAVAPKYGEKRRQVGVLNNLLETNLGGVATIKTYGTESKERERVERASDEYRVVSWEAYKMRVALLTSALAGSSVSYIVTFLVGGIWLVNGPPLFFTQTLSVGTLVAFLLYANRFQGPLLQFTDVVDAYQSSLAAATRVLELHGHEPTVEAPSDGVVLDDCDGHITFDDVSFAYDGNDEYTLQDISFEAEPGEFVGIVGPTGSGKSTLMKLLVRLYDTDEGAISVDGHPIDSLTLDSLRGNVGTVSQEPFLFDSRVVDNMTYGCGEDFERREVERAAELAGAHEFVTELQDGYETEVGERGVKLSGGQRQRIALTRAILRDPQVLILDEATSHVDNETEAVIQESIAELTTDRTTFVIAHRLSTVRDADTILVVEDGDIVEQGDHAELVNRGGLYADLWQVQVGETGRSLVDGQHG